jgi:hypothetical protein
MLSPKSTIRWQCAANLLLFAIHSISINTPSRQGLARKPRKGGGFGAQGAAERPEEATVRDHEPYSQRLRSCSRKPDGEA